MRFIRFILIDLALMLLAPESAKANIVATDANFKSARKAVGSVMPNSGPEPVSGSGVLRQLHCQAFQAAPFQHSLEALGPPSRLTTLRCWNGALPLIGKRSGQCPVATLLAARSC